jgi:hypothetical protein
MKQSNYETIEKILEKIEDPAIQIVAIHSLEKAREELDIGEYGRGQVKNVADKIDRVLTKAMHQRIKNASI